MKKIVLAVMFFVSLSNSQEIDIWNRLSDQYTSSQKKEDTTSKPAQSNSINSPQYISNKTKQDISVEPTHPYNNAQIGVVQGLDPNGDGFLSLRVKPKSKEIGRLYNGDVVEILDRSGKYYKVKDIKSSQIGWAHSNWIKRTTSADFLLADIDNDGQKECLQWYKVEINDGYENSYNQLVLFDYNGHLLWKGNDSIAPIDSIGGEVTVPVIFDDIDLDGNIEFILWYQPHELSPGFFDIYRWNGKKFKRVTKTKYAIDLVWVDAPNGNTLQWKQIDYKDFTKKKKIWWVHHLSQMPNSELPTANIVGVQFPNFNTFQDSKAKIRFTPTGAVIEEWIKKTPSENNTQKSDENNVIHQSNNTVSNELECIHFEVIGVKALNLRDKPGKPSNIIGKVNMRENVCIYESQGKWARSDRGWLSMKYLRKNIRKNKFLLADIDSDGKKERLQWYEVLDNDEEGYYQLKLFDDNGNLLWKGNDSIAPITPVGMTIPVIFDDIDGDGNTELIIYSPPSELDPPIYEIFRWTGKKFTGTTRTKYVDLVWIDAPYGRTLKWTKLADKYDRKRNKIWWVGELWQMPNNELPMADILGVQYPDYKVFFRSNAKIRFTPTGAIIEEWIK